jgi:predicted amidophosphoribosyltransferase
VGYPWGCLITLASCSLGATMPKGYPLSSCRGCQKPIADRRELSATGLCAACGPRIQREALIQISEHRGPWFRLWRERMAASVGGRLLDEPRGSD